MSTVYRQEQRVRVLLVGALIGCAILFALAYQLRSKTSRSSPDSFDSFAPSGFRALNDLLVWKGFDVRADIAGFVDPAHADPSETCIAFLSPRMRDELSPSHAERLPAVLNVPGIRAIVALKRYETQITENRDAGYWEVDEREMSYEDSLSVLKGSWLERKVSLSLGPHQTPFGLGSLTAPPSYPGIRKFSGENIFSKLYEGPEGQRVIVLSDPYFLTNEGLRSKGAGEFALGLFQELGATSILIDESQHNRTETISVEEVLLQPPYLWMTLCAFAMVLLFFWNQSARVSRRATVLDQRQSRSHALRAFSRFLARSKDTDSAAYAAQQRLEHAARSCLKAQRALTGGADGEAKRQARRIQEGFARSLGRTESGQVEEATFVNQARYFARELRELDHERNSTSTT